jgi:hypothetical protein
MEQYACCWSQEDSTDYKRERDSINPNLCLSRKKEIAMAMKDKLQLWISIVSISTFGDTLNMKFTPHPLPTLTSYGNAS